MAGAAKQSVADLWQDWQQVFPERSAGLARLREQILALGAVSEEVKYGGVLFARDGQAFCGVFCYSAHSTLEFSHGASLPDEAGVLSGQGKLRRHVRLSVGAEAATPAVLAVLQQAYQLAAV